MFIKVKCHPGSKKESINKKDEETLEVFVKEKPERGEANKRVLEILSEHFKVSFRKIKIVKGAKSQNKIFEIHE